MHGDIKTSIQWQMAFGAALHTVERARSAEEASMLLRDARFDLLLFDFLVDGESGLSTALLAQFHQPQMGAVLVSDHALELQGDLFSRLSNLRCVLAPQTPIDDLVSICEAAAMPAHVRRAVGQLDIYNTAWS
jgi:hypothetical protein